MYFVIGICGVCETRQAKDQLDIFMVGYGAKRIAFDCYYRQSQPKAIKPHRVTDGVCTNNRMLFFDWIMFGTRTCCQQVLFVLFQTISKFILQHIIIFVKFFGYNKYRFLVKIFFVYSAHSIRLLKNTNMAL